MQLSVLCCSVLLACCNFSVLCHLSLLCSGSFALLGACCKWSRPCNGLLVMMKSGSGNGPRCCESKLG
ncbi:hypothetical protein PVAP13_3NG258181 [Panicum virgatum]|uniref:Secreted protein n=1 Tax=Panicum virgatum TaxID=38727 RepID=A0A8T0UAW9_PANVG|nr:hypothetical protein PVAP13_3NG258181 [Panicum virgatum]